jgi:arylsulfatase A-like enzyme
MMSERTGDATMTDRLREASENAIDAMEHAITYVPDSLVMLLDKTIREVRAALTEPAERVEPVAWYLEAEGDEPAIFHPKHIEGWTPLYEHPPAPPASTEEDVKVVRLTREKYEAMCYLIDEIPALHIRMALLALLGDWPAQEGR